MGENNALDDDVFGANAEWELQLPGISYSMSEGSEAVSMNYCIYLHSLSL